MPSSSTELVPLRKWTSKLRQLPHKESSLGYLLTSPAFLFLAFMLAYPFIYAIYLSLTDKRLGEPASFVGLRNFVVLAQSALFWKVVRNSVVYTLGALLLKFLGGLGIAVLMNREFVGKRLARAALLLPWIIPIVFTAMVWGWILDPTYGIINLLLKRWGIIQTSLPFLLQPAWAMASLILVDFWRGVPFFAITSLAALQSVPEELLEASRIDGATAWQCFWKVSFPLMIPVVVIVVLISAVGTLSMFDLPFVLTAGGPQDATNLFAIMSYRQLRGGGLVGIGAAVSLSMFPILALLMVQSLLQLRRED